MLRHIVLLSVIARCAAFGSYSGPGGKTDGACIDEPDHVVAEEAAKMGYAQYTSCAAIAQAGGCQLTGAACCATCASSGELTEQRVGNGGLKGPEPGAWGGWGGSVCPGLNAYTLTAQGRTEIMDSPECGNCLPGCDYGHGCRDHGDGYANWCYIDRPGLIENACVNQWTGAATAYIGRGAGTPPASGRLWSYCCRTQGSDYKCGPESVCPSNYPYAYRPTRNFDYCCATADGNGAYTEVTKNAYCGNRVISKYAKDVQACFAAVKADPACGNGFSFYGGTNYGGTKYCDCPPRGELCEAVPFNTGAAPNIYTVYRLNRELGANRNPWMQYRSGSCKDDNFIECAKPPCDDHGGVGTGRSGWESKEVVVDDGHRRRSGIKQDAVELIG